MVLQQAITSRRVRREKRIDLRAPGLASPKFLEELHHGGRVVGSRDTHASGVDVAISDVLNIGVCFLAKCGGARG
jgi:hypothetical protein